MLETMQEVLRACPQLTIAGYSAYVFKGCRTVEARARRERELARWHAEMLQPRQLVRFGRARDWLRQWPKLDPNGRFRQLASLLGYEAEPLIGHTPGAIFQAALLAEGFVLRQAAHGGVYTNTPPEAWRAAHASWVGYKRPTPPEQLW